MNWEWDITKIAVCCMTGTIVDLVIEMIKLLAPDCQQVRSFGFTVNNNQALFMASVIGHTFNIEILSFLLEMNMTKCVEIIWPAVQANLLWSM